MSTRLLVAGLVMLSACGYTRERYAQESAAAACQLLTDCEDLAVYGHASQDTCLDTIEEQETADADACDDWQADAAITCVEGISELSCEDLVDGVWPEACDSLCG